MKLHFALSPLAALALAGCATPGDTQLAQADCKVYPVATASAGGGKPQVDSLRQRAAQADLATSSYRLRNLDRNGMFNNNIEDILRDCNR